MTISAETCSFLQKQLYFGRNRSVSAEIRLFRQNILFRPNFGFLKWPVSVFGVSVKNLFRSNTTVRTIFGLQKAHEKAPKEEE